ncbi:hypothetical protein DFH06DRAFT_956785, partial [Mycena polygramma]
MSLWRPLAGKFLDGLMRREGLGDYTYDPACALCKTPHSPTRHLFRCDQCGEFLQCLDCVMSRHALSPLHSLREWNGSHWIEAYLSGGGEETLGLVYQVGHHGFACRWPRPPRTMVVIDVTGIYTLQIQYCDCERKDRTAMGELGQLLGNAWYPATTVDPETCATLQALETFRLLNVVGNITVQDYVRSLERKMD